MIEYNKITKKALYEMAVWQEAKIAELNAEAARAEAAQEEAAATAESDAHEIRTKLNSFESRAKYAEELSAYARQDRDGLKFELSSLQERLGIAGMAILESHAGTA